MSSPPPPSGDPRWSRPTGPAGSAGLPGRYDSLGTGPPGPPSGGGFGAPVPAGGGVCTWHRDRPTNLTCSRCGRPACPACLAPASVGFHCRACVAEARPAARSSMARTVAGAAHGRQPRVTYTLIGLNVLVFVAVAIQAGSLGSFRGSSIYNGSMLVPMFVAGGEWWRLVASGFLHLSVTHILLNMLALYFIGLGLERVLGRWRYLALYLLSLLGGSAAIMLFSPVSGGSAGASGAIFGLMGALLVTLKRLNLDMRQAGIIIAINIIATFTIPGISWQAHIGGLVVGAIVGAAMVYPPAPKRFQWQVGSCIAMFVVLAAVIIAKDVSLGSDVTGLDTFRVSARCFGLNT